ncbi:hypothetical protein ACFQAT_25965 [Undibacterium arcticum]|uniref:hypothetical protein n=1 Tax=Undibacterium arcticum TaxID=1762892 RepID=UPI00361FE646
MEKVTDIKQYAIDKAKAGYSMVGQECVRVAELDRHGDQALKAILKAINLNEERRIVFHAWPNLQVACVKYCELVSRKYPGVRGPLADETIERHSLPSIFRQDAVSRKFTAWFDS